MLTGPLCEAARALTELTREELAALSGVDAVIIERFERRVAEPDAETIATLRATLEEMGASFIPEDSRGVGVRLKFTAAETRRIATLEGEGGPARNDDVP